MYLLSYLAARPGLRSQGVGTGLMHHLPVWSRERGSALVTLAEVDDPRCHDAESLVGISPCGSLSTGDSAPECSIFRIFNRASLLGGRRGRGMLLLAFDVDGQPAWLEVRLPRAPRRSTRALAARRLRRLGTPPTGRRRHALDPDLDRLLGQASSPAGVPLLPVEHYADVTPDVADGTDS